MQEGSVRDAVGHVLDSTMLCSQSLLPASNTMTRKLDANIRSPDALLIRSMLMKYLGYSGRHNTSGERVRSFKGDLVSPTSAAEVPAASDTHL